LTRTSQGYLIHCLHMQNQGQSQPQQPQGNKPMAPSQSMETIPITTSLKSSNTDKETMKVSLQKVNPKTSKPNGSAPTTSKTPVTPPPNATPAPSPLTGMSTPPPPPQNQSQISPMAQSVARKATATSSIVLPGAKNQAARPAPSASSISTMQTSSIPMSGNPAPPAPAVSLNESAGTTQMIRLPEPQLEPVAPAPAKNISGVPAITSKAPLPSKNSKNPVAPTQNTSTLEANHSLPQKNKENDSLFVTLALLGAVIGLGALGFLLASFLGS
jgi:hypothetical protein